MFQVTVEIIGTLYLISFVIAQENTKPFDIKDKIDWSKWTTVEGYSSTEEIQVSTSAFPKEPITLDWSRWDEKNQLTPSNRPYIEEKVEKINDWLKRTTVESVSIRQRIQKKQNELPRKPKVTEQNFIEAQETKLNLPQSIFNAVKDAKQKTENKIKIFSTAQEDLKSIEDELSNTESQNTNIDTDNQIINAKVIGGINWSLWNENSLATNSNKEQPSTSEPNEVNPTQIDEPILPSTQPVLFKPNNIDDKPLESLKESEEENVPSFFGWPWWAWLICAIITAILLGMVYVAVFWNDFKDCIHGREIFCSVSRNDK